MTDFILVLGWCVVRNIMSIVQNTLSLGWFQGQDIQKNQIPHF